MLINNYDRIKNLLEWDKTGDLFYFIQILQRKKDHGVGKVNGANNNSRAVKEYYVYTPERLEFYMDEIIKLCDVFGARAGINLNRRSFKKLWVKHQKKCLTQFENAAYNKIHKSFSSVCGKYSAEEKTNKKWILDIDETPYNTAIMDEFLYTLQPVGNKIIDVLPSKSGLHIITKPFNVHEFKKVHPGIEVCKNNPTNLYIP